MTTILVQCPECKTRYKIKNAEAMQGKKVLCKSCRQPLRIRLPKTASQEPSDEEAFGGGEPFGDEFAAAGDEMPARAPLPAKRPKKPGTFKKSGDASGKRKSGAGKTESDAGGSRNIVVVVIVLVVGAIVLGGIGVGGVLLIRTGVQGAKYQAPDDAQYVDFHPKDSGISCRIPKSWTQDWGGGQGGQPYWVRFGDDRLKIEARESIAGGAMAQAAIALQQKLDPGQRDESYSPAAKVHEAQQHDFAENFEGYHEEPPRKVTTQFGEGRISDFTAKEGIFKSTVNGCRVTLLNNLHQFTVSFKCSPGLFQDEKPVFEKIVSSIGPGRGP